MPFCGSTDAAHILISASNRWRIISLTPTDLAKKEPKFPLRLAVCKSCWMLQITDLVPPVELFSEYLYFSLVLRSDAPPLARGRCDGYMKEFGLNGLSLCRRSRE